MQSSIKIRANYHFLFALSLEVTLIFLVLVACNNANARTLESIINERKSLGNGPQIMVGKFPMDIQVNQVTGKIYVANAGSDSVSVIDSDAGGLPKSISVGFEPTSIAIDEDSDKIFVANQGSGSVSVIDGHNDTVIKDIPIGVKNKSLSMLGINGIAMHIIYDKSSDKIYVANPGSNTVSVINGTTFSKIKDIPGFNIPVYPAIRLPNFLFGGGRTIYVANFGNHNVSVIDGNSNNKTKNDIDLGVLKIGHKIYANPPSKLLVFNNKIFAIKFKNVSVICQPFYEEICRPLHDITIKHPITAVATANHIYIVNGSSVKLKLLQHGISIPTGEYGNGTVSVINPYATAKCDMTNYTVPCDTMEHDIPVGKEPFDIVVGDGKYYVSNNGSNTVSVIDDSTSMKKPDILVGIRPTKVAYDAKTNMIYVVNRGNVSQPTMQMAFGQSILGHFNPFSSAGPGTVSVIDGSSDKVAAGVILSVNPANSGRIICSGTDYPTNVYLFVDAGTICIAQPNKDFEFNNWVENLPTNRNSTIPLSSSGNLTVNRYGMFTVNFKQPHPLSSQELFTYLTGAISAGVAINGAILTVPGWRRARKQRTNLKQCIKMIDDDVTKTDKNAIEKKILGYYVEGKLSEDHRQLLKDKISEYYEEKAER